MAPLSPPFSKAMISGVSSVMVICFIPCLSRLQAYPMLRAVSVLSPVSTHILMPALASLSMQLVTPFCSLSSTAAAPNRIKSLSIKSVASSISSSRSALTEFLAAVKFLSNLVYSISSS
uniref:Uncharacterized protein n=1 Tax=Triticum urartu TaxID=4572 RepID=A0A8R7RAJ2_TRIUA